MTNKLKAVVLFSGGLDSLVTLAVAIKECGLKNVKALSFTYGQVHNRETFYAKKLAKYFGVSFTSIDITDTLKSFSTGSILKGGTASKIKTKLPKEFVPGRNVVFFSLASIFAYTHKCNVLYTGVSQIENYNGYPDCRTGFVSAMSTALRLGVGFSDKLQPFEIITPLMFKDKCDTFKLADELGVLSLALLNTLSCFKGDDSKMHPYGLGCDKCSACVTRKLGFEEFISL